MECPHLRKSALSTLRSRRQPLNQAATGRSLPKLRQAAKRTRPSPYRQEVMSTSHRGRYFNPSMTIRSALHCRPGIRNNTMPSCKWPSLPIAVSVTRAPGLTSGFSVTDCNDQDSRQQWRFVAGITQVKVNVNTGQEWCLDGGEAPDVVHRITINTVSSLPAPTRLVT